MINEKSFNPQSGYLMLFAAFLLLAISITGYIMTGFVGPRYELAILYSIGASLLLIGFILVMPGFFVVHPNESRVMVLFGTYKGTIKDFGFYWVNPFMTKLNVSLRARNFQGEVVKVNDKLGNPIEIATVVVWQVENTSKAAFDVDDYVTFVKIQSESALRSLAGKYPYDNFDDEQSDIALRAGAATVNAELENELRDRLSIAGIHIIEARISHLAYAQEIAGAMLQRQQATAVVAARFKIVEGAVSMVEMALQHLAAKKTVQLDESQKAAMVSNLMVVLCGDRSASPVINAGTLHQ